MKQLRIGDITIDAVIEREGPWRRPQDFFPAYDDAVFKHHLGALCYGIVLAAWDRGLGSVINGQGIMRSDIGARSPISPRTRSS